MHMQDLSKQKALELLPYVVDGEAAAEERRAFYDYIEADAEVKQIFESQLRIKELIQNRCRKSKAPDYLKSRIIRILDEENMHNADTKLDIDTHIPLKKEINNSTSKITAGTKTGKLNRIYRAAIAIAAVLILSIFTIEILERLSPTLQSTMSIEEFALSHFSNSDGQISFAGFQPGSLNEAHQLLIEEYNFDIEMPAIDGAEITQVIYTDFVPDYKTPVLEYHHTGSGEYIYIFAFKIDSLKQYQQLIRDPEAVEKCKSIDDFHIKEIENMHVVSWKWGDNWYAAVSNHNGHDLAAIVAPNHNW
jgi:cell fate (sporulation/competence/biofilm development) regulator YlbF (YheA/YmcA/DUF963 family)